MFNEKELLIVNGKEMKFPLSVGERFIHLCNINGVNKFAIGSDDRELFTDHEECTYFGMEKEEYQEILKSFGAKQFHHEFDYGDHVLPVQDSYFDDFESANKCLNHLMNL